MKKTIVLFTILASINILTYFIWMPYMQQTANMHMNEGPFWSIVFYILAGVILTIAIFKIRKMKSKVDFVILLMMSISFVFWAYQMEQITCLRCKIC